MQAKSASKSIKVRKNVFDEALKAVLQSGPIRREKIKTRGKGGPKTPILQKP